MEQLLNKRQVAALLGVSERSIDRLRASRALVAVKVGQCVRFHPEHVEEFTKRRQERKSV